jgi:gamma-glutamyltranspeptidase/glutathione hydrolase
VRVGVDRNPWRNLIPATEGCVVSYCPIASAIGSRVLIEGGNAVDAVVATALALSATYPQAGNLAGGGFMLIKPFNGEAELLDYRESAPRAIDAKMFKDAREHSTRGGLAVAVPGTVAGLGAAIERYGTWSWDRLVRSAVEVAELGLWVTNRQARYLELYHKDLCIFPETARALLPADGSMWKPGDLFRNPDLAKTLRTLGSEGPKAFSEGQIAEAIIRTTRRYGGVLDLQDLRDYRPIWRKPYQRKLFGHDVLTTSLPSGGGFVILTSLALLEAAGCTDLPVRSSARYELLGRAFRIAFALRSEFAGDPAIVPPDLLARCEALTNAPFDAGSIERFERALGLTDEPAKREPSPPRNTTHIAAIDSNGMAVSNTYSLNTLFGSKLVAEGTGTLLNNTIDDFGIADVPNWYSLLEGKHNRLAPGLRPLGNMAPTIVCSEGIAELAIGGSGGPRIPTAVAQTILGMYGNNMALAQAATMPRVHHQHWPTQLDVEDSLDQQHKEALERLGYEVVQFPRLGILAAVQYDVNLKTLMALLDSRF